MEYKDYYKTLGVEKTVGKDELKKQYRKLARQYHPDVNTTDKNAATKFSEISEAYEVLSNDEKRKKYDAFGSDWAQHQNSGQANEFDWSKYASQRNGQEGNSGHNWEDIFGQGSDSSDFFRSIFEQGFQGQEGVRLARKGHDLKAVLTLSLKEAYDGGDRILTIGDSKIRLKLKPGIWDRQKIRIAGKGAPGINGAESGDLFITFHLQPDTEYRLEGTNLFKEIPLSIYAAMLGTSIEVQTISGKFDLKIPPETKNGTVLRLKGRGFPVYGKPDSHGDLFLKVTLQLPEKLTEQEKKLIRELTALRAEKVNEKQV